MKKKKSIQNLEEKMPRNSFKDDNENLDKKPITAKDVMIKPIFLYPEDDATTIIKKLKREETNVCIVVTKDKKFIGEISDEDLIKLFLRQVKYEPLVQIFNLGYRREFLYRSARELINKHKSTAKINDPINKVIKLIYKEGFNYIPVLNDHKKVVGVVTPSTLIDFLQNE